MLVDYEVRGRPNQLSLGKFMRAPAFFAVLVARQIRSFQRHTLACPPGQKTDDRRIRMAMLLELMVASKKSNLPVMATTPFQVQIAVSVCGGINTRKLRTVDSVEYEFELIFRLVQV